MKSKLVQVVLAVGIVLGVLFVAANSMGFVEQLSSSNEAGDGVEDEGPPESLTESQHDRVEIEDPPSERRYVNEYEPKEPPRWKPEISFSRADLRRTRPDPVEVTRFPNVEPTREHLDSAWEMYNRSYEAADENGWFTFEEGLKDGFRKYDFFHYQNPKYYLDDRSLDPNRPEALMYYPDPNDSDNDSSKILAGFMYMSTSLEEEGRQFGGPLTVWHYHSVPETCFAGILSFSPTFGEYDCEGEPKKHRTPEMIHVWFLKNPEGPFASRMHVPERYVQEPEKMSEEEFKRYTMKAYERYRNPS